MGGRKDHLYGGSELTVFTNLKSLTTHIPLPISYPTNQIFFSYKFYLQYKIFLNYKQTFYLFFYFYIFNYI